MEFSYPAVLIVPLGLGLLGFIEPCTIGGHLIFLRAIAEKPLSQRAASTLTFTLVRTLTMGSLGAVAALIGRRLIDMQTTFWLVFGSVYLLIGLAYAFNRAGALQHGISLAPQSWKLTSNPLVLGGVLGLNIPACAAPILFGLIGLAASSGAVSLGFATMAVFALALSAPLAVLAVSPVAGSLVARFKRSSPALRWAFAALFVALGVWSLWFGLFVDPADWSSI